MPVKSSPGNRRKVEKRKKVATRDEKNFKFQSELEQQGRMQCSCMCEGGACLMYVFIMKMSRVNDPGKWKQYNIKERRKIKTQKYSKVFRNFS